MNELSLHVKEMKGGACVQTVERALTELFGVERALADLDTGLIRLDYDENEVSKQQIVGVIEGVGYEVEMEDKGNNNE